MCSPPCVPFGDFDFSEVKLLPQMKAGALKDLRLARGYRVLPGGGALELATVALPVVNGKSVKCYTCLEQVIEED